MATPSERIERLAAEAAGILGAAEMSMLPAAELVAVTAAIEHLGRAVDDRRVAAAAVVERRSARFLGTAGLAQSYGYRRGSELLEQTAGVSGAEARRRIRLGALVAPREDDLGTRLPPLYPDVAAAMATGGLGVESAHAITTELEATGSRADPSALRIAERMLVAIGAGERLGVSIPSPEDIASAGLTAHEIAFAMGPSANDDLPLPAEQVACRAQLWRDVLDPDGVEPRADLARRQREVSLSRTPRDGLHTLRGRLTPDVASQLFAFFDTLITRPRTSFAPAIAPDDEAPEDRRTHTQKCHDLLAGVLRAAGAAMNAGIADTDTSGPESTPVAAPVPLIVATDTAQLAKGASGTGTISGIEGRVPLSYLAQLACDGGIQPLIAHGGRPVKLSSPGRFFTQVQRRATAVRDGHTCLIPGCDMPFPTLEAHHVIPFSHGGPTTVDNCALLCWWHHHLLDAGIWEIHMIRGKPRTRIPIRDSLRAAA